MDVDSSLWCNNVDEEQVGSDLITLSDDTVFMTDADVIDMSSMDLDDSDVSFMLWFPIKCPSIVTLVENRRK